MKYSGILLGSMALSASAFPAVMQTGAIHQAHALQGRSIDELHKRSEAEKRQVQAVSPAGVVLSQARDNCGVIPCATFDGEHQLVSITGEHAYASPAADEIRGPCPGLNAAANHGYLSRSGVTTIQETVTGLGTAFGMAPDLAGFLAAYAIIFDGDPVEGTWSIGGPQPSNGLTDSILGKPQGISYSHNVYEGDASMSRSDAYLNNGDAHSLIMERFASAYAATDSRYPGQYTLDSFVQNFGAKTQESIDQNPYYFTGPFATTLVAPAAYNFVINFMSNHTAENPGGYLDGEMFKTFFAVTGDSPDEFVWLPGQERIPENWYKRTDANQYSIADAFGDLGVGWLAYPDTFRLGGNTNGVGTYAGISLSDFTGGAYNLTDLANSDGSAGTCFGAELVQAVIPDVASLPLQLVQPITDLVNNYIKPVTGNLECAEVNSFDQGLFNNYPGHTYSPTGPATNY